jgi:sigma54-dependent transcription regulator
MLALNLAVALTSLLTVSAHGRIKTVTSNGVTSHLWEPWQDRFLNPVPATVGERYDTVDPLEVGDFGKSIMTCRQGEQAASVCSTSRRVRILTTAMQLDGSNPVQSQRVQAGSVLKTDWYEL